MYRHPSGDVPLGGRSGVAAATSAQAGQSLCSEQLDRFTIGGPRKPLGGKSPVWEALCDHENVDLGDLLRRQGEARRRIESLAPQANDNVVRQHVVSRVILKRFAAEAPHRRVGNIAIMNLEYPDAKPVYRGPRGCGYVDNFVRYASRSLEQLWNLTESALGDALAACSDGSIFSNDRHVKTLKDAIALHFVRSVHTRPFLDQLWQGYLPQFREDFISAYGHRLAAAFARQYHGLLPAGREGLGAVFDRMLLPTLALREADAFFRDSLERLFRLASRHLDGLGVEVCRSLRCEFIIGDAPALAIGNEGRIGLMQGVGFETAMTIALPVGPRLLISTGPSNAFHDFDKEQVDLLNQYQVTSAKRHVYCRPGSEEVALRSVSPISGTRWPQERTVRPPRGPVRRRMG